MLYAIHVLEKYVYHFTSSIILYFMKMIDIDIDIFSFHLKFVILFLPIQYGEEDSFDLTIFRSYINELLQYKRDISYSISDATISLIFWRGQVQFGSWPIPLHSALFYIGGMIVFERLDLLPAVFFFSTAWIFLACMGERINHPSPWEKCNTFLHFLTILLFGQSSSSSLSSSSSSFPSSSTFKIASNENKEQISMYENAMQNRVEKDYEAAIKRAEIENKINNEIGNENIQTVINGMFEIEMLNRFGRWQRIVGRKCVQMTLFLFFP